MRRYGTLQRVRTSASGGSIWDKSGHQLSNNLVPAVHAQAFLRGDSHRDFADGTVPQREWRPVVPVTCLSATCTLIRSCRLDPRCEPRARKCAVCRSGKDGWKRRDESAVNLGGSGAQPRTAAGTGDRSATRGAAKPRDDASTEAQKVAVSRAPRLFAVEAGDVPSVRAILAVNPDLVHARHNDGAAALESATPSGAART